MKIFHSHKETIKKACILQESISFFKFENKKVRMHHLDFIMTPRFF